MQIRSRRITTFFLIILGVVVILLGVSGTYKSVREYLTQPTPEDTEEIVDEQGFEPMIAPGDQNQETPLATLEPLQIQTIEPNTTPAVTVDPAVQARIATEYQAYVNSFNQVMTLQPTLEKTYPPAIPDRIVIPAIRLDAPIVQADEQTVRIGGDNFGRWVAPNQFAAGWHPNSAFLGQVGNTVINGHHNAFGEVFRYLVDLNTGDFIFVYTGERIFRYVVANKMILQERGVTVEQKLDNARWILPSADERLTLVTCWPYDSNTHRLIIVAAPLK